MKKILVVSHERSGTHFLINTIARNFGYDNNQLEVFARDTISIDPEEGKRYKSKVNANINKSFPSQTKKIFKSHHQFEFFKEHFDEILEHYHVFYIIRDARDVLTSCYFYFNAAQTKAFPKPRSVKELAFDIKPYKYPFDGAYSLVKSEDFVERWIKHVSGWIHSGACVITYEDLKSNFNLVLRRVSRELERDPTGSHIPTLRDRAVSPRKGIIGDWINHLPIEYSKKIWQRAKQAKLAGFIH